MSLLPHMVWESGSSPRHAVIWLHGLGAAGSDFVPVAQMMRLPFAARHVFPDAPERPVTLNGGYVMRAWYDIVADDIGRQPDEAGIRASQAEVERFIAREMENGIAQQNIFLAGFSQGGAVALHTGLRHEARLGGVLALSTYLPMAERAASERAAAAQNLPIFMAHGFNDPIVAFALGKRSAENLSALGCDVAWHEYVMQHALCADEVADIEAWLTNPMRNAA